MAWNARPANIAKSTITRDEKKTIAMQEPIDKKATKVPITRRESALQSIEPAQLQATKDSITRRDTADVSASVSSSKNSITRKVSDVETQSLMTAPSDRWTLKGAALPADSKNEKAKVQTNKCSEV